MSMSFDFTIYNNSDCLKYAVSVNQLITFLQCKFCRDVIRDDVNCNNNDINCDDYSDIGFIAENPYDTRSVNVSFCPKHYTNAIQSMNAYKWLQWNIPIVNNKNSYSTVYRVVRSCGTYEDDWSLHSIKYSLCDNEMVAFMYKKYCIIKVISLKEFILNNKDVKLSVVPEENQFFDINRVNYINEYLGYELLVL